jgi:hypothetical protein
VEKPSHEGRQGFTVKWEVLSGFPGDREGKQMAFGLHTCRGGALGVKSLPFSSFKKKIPVTDASRGGVMKKAFLVCLGLVISFAVLQQMTYSKGMAASNVGSSEATAWEYGSASPQNACITQCATLRDNCRTNACTSVGGQSDTAQACRNVPPARVQDFNRMVQACFDQEKKCDAGCPSH